MLDDPLKTIRDLVRDGKMPAWVLAEHERQLAAKQASEPPLPSLGRMVKGFIQSAVAVVASGGEQASEAEQADRWSTCRACDQFRESDGRCGGMTGCGCDLAGKIPWKAVSCPVGKWPSL